MKFLKYLPITLLLLSAVWGCKKEEQGAPISPAVYLVANTITGPGSTAVTAMGNTASGKVSVSPAVAKIYVNAPQSTDLTIYYKLSGTAVAGTNYTTPDPMSVTIPAGTWTGKISIPIINTALSGNKTIIITLDSASNNTQLGLGSGKAYNTFTYTLTN